MARRALLDGKDTIDGVSWERRDKSAVASSDGNEGAENDAVGHHVHERSRRSFTLQNVNIFWRESAARLQVLMPRTYNHTSRTPTP